jgi:sec-independent protein translocase protein TatA
MAPLTPLIVGIPAGPELILILAVVVLLFGANKLPQLARSSGQAMGEFKKGRQDIEHDLREATGAESADEAGDEA